MNIQKFTFNPFQENTYVIYHKNKCIIIDPGCYTIEEEEILQGFIEKNTLEPIKILNTHAHIDHILGNQFVAEKWNIDIFMHKYDMPILENARKTAEMYGLTQYKTSPLPKYFLDEQDIIDFEGTKLNIFFTPGHSPGHICFYNKSSNILISGDVIFKNSIGRTDLPGGDYTTLMNSITSKILCLPEKTSIFCGHGDVTSLADEKKYNPFLQ